MIRLLRTPHRLRYWGILSGAVRPQHVNISIYGDEWNILRGKEEFILFHEDDTIYPFRWAKEEELLEFLTSCTMENTIPGCRISVAWIDGEFVGGLTARWWRNNYEELRLVDGEAKWVEA